MRLMNSVLMAAAVLLIGVSALGAIVERVGLVELAREADLVVVGTVQSTAGRYEDPPNQHRIVTDATIHVNRVVRGELGPVDPLVVTILGGTVGESGQLVPGAPRLGEGDEVVLFLRSGKRKSDGSWRRTVIGLSQGVFHVFEEPETGIRKARQRLSGLTLSPVVPKEGSALEFGLDELTRIVESAGRGR